MLKTHNHLLFMGRAFLWYYKTLPKLPKNYLDPISRINKLYLKLFQFFLPKNFFKQKSVWFLQNMEALLLNFTKTLYPILDILAVQYVCISSWLLQFILTFLYAWNFLCMHEGGKKGYFID